MTRRATTTSPRSPSTCSPSDGSRDALEVVATSVQATVVVHRATGARRWCAGYRTAVDRERYGRTGSPSTGGFGGGSGGTSGGNRSDRQPDRNRGGQPAQGDRGAGTRTAAATGRMPEPRERFERTERPVASAEPWSEVPADVQEMLRAELARKQPATRPQPASQAPHAEPARTAPSTGRSRRAATPAAAAEATPVAAADAVRG